MKNKILLFLFLTIALSLTAAPTLAAGINEINLTFEGIGQITPRVQNGSSSYWPFSGMIKYFLDQGVSVDVIYLILSVPLITLVIAFFRQIIGISTFGLYMPLIIALSFELLGVIFGLVILLLVIIVSYLLRRIIGKMNLLYIPRTSFLLSFIALSFFIVIWFSINYGSPVAIGLAIFPMLMMSTISERISSVQFEEGIAGALKGVIQTIIVALVSYYFASWPWLTNLIIGYPEIIILPLIFILIIGRFTGLRLIEYFRFRTLFRDSVEEE